MKEFKFDGTRFCVDIDTRTRTPYIHSVHPYDMTEYHWARQIPNSHRWDFFRNGRTVETLEPKHDLHGDALFERIAEELVNLDTLANLKPNIDRT